jgi:hypothetical protein
MIELKPDMRMDFTGKQIEFGQWQVYVDGYHVAYLNHQPDSELQPCRVNFPVERMDEIVKACEAERERLGKPSKVLPTPEHNLRFIEAHKVIEQQQASEEDDE